MSSDQQPTINEQGIVTLIHILGGFFYFLPALIGLFAINNLSENAKNSIKQALNYQISVSLLCAILFLFAQIASIAALLLFPIIGLVWLLFTVIPLANFIISLIVGLSYYNNGTTKYPPYFVFIK